MLLNLSEHVTPIYKKIIFFAKQIKIYLLPYRCCFLDKSGDFKIINLSRLIN